MRYALPLKKNSFVTENRSFRFCLLTLRFFYMKCSILHLSSSCVKLLYYTSETEHQRVRRPPLTLFQTASITESSRITLLFESSSSSAYLKSTLNKFTEHFLRDPIRDTKYHNREFLS